VGIIPPAPPRPPRRGAGTATQIVMPMAAGRAGVAAIATMYTPALLAAAEASIHADNVAKVTKRVRSRVRQLCT